MLGLEESGNKSRRQCNIRQSETIKMSEFKNELGNVYGRLTVVNREYPKRTLLMRHRAIWRVRCSCGNEMTVSGNLLRQRLYRECGTCAQEWGKKDD